MSTGIMPPPEITETGPSSHPLPMASDLLYSFQQWLIMHNLATATPLVLFFFGLILRTFLSVYFGNDAFVFTIMLGLGTWYITSGVTKDFIDDTKELSSESTSINKDLKTAKEESKRKDPRKLPKTHDTTDELKRR